MPENKAVPFARDIYLAGGEAVFRVSLKDLARQLPHVTEIITQGGLNPVVIPYLYRMGMDVGHDVALSVALYRDSSTNRPAVSALIVGKERTDSEWAGSSKSSLQATIGRNRDPWLRSDLYQLAGLNMSSVEDLASIDEPDLQTMEKTILRYMDAGEESEVVQKIEQLKSEIKMLYDIDCMI